MVIAVDLLDVKACPDHSPLEVRFGPMMATLKIKCDIKWLEFIELLDFKPSVVGTWEQGSLCTIG